MAVAPPLCLALVLSGVQSPAHAQTPQASMQWAYTTPATFGLSDSQVEELLIAIDSIPDAVLDEGEEATAEWMQEILLPKNATPAVATQAACVGAILWAIGSAMLPIAKVKRIKALIKELGGVRAAVAKLWQHNFSWPSVKQAGGALRDLGAEILGVAGVAEYCFNA